jgi:SAM-dependent methyltransferase
VTESLVDGLRAQEASWNRRPLVRALYKSWFGELCASLAEVDGRSIELGAGIAMLPQTCPRVEATDVEPTPWVSEIADAEALPYDDCTLANLVLVDVFHHLARPARFLDEAVRVLVPGGRVLVLDPYCSPVSTRTYRWFHHERTDLSAAPFDDDASIADAPLASNQARSTLAFFRHGDELVERWPMFRIVERRRLALLAYPLSGGFTGRQLVPAGLGRGLARLERRLGLLAALMATRCLVALQRQPSATDAHDLDAELPERE